MRINNVLFFPFFETLCFQNPRKISSASTKYQRSFDSLYYIQALTSLDMGKPMELATFEVMFAAEVISYYAGWCDKISGKTLPAPSMYILLNYCISFLFTVNTFIIACL